MFDTCKLGFLLVVAGALALLSGGVRGNSHAATYEAQQLAGIKGLLKLDGKELLKVKDLLALLKRPAGNEPLEQDQVVEQPEEEVVVIVPPTEIEEQRPPNRPTHLTIVVGKPQPLPEEQPQHAEPEHAPESRPEHESSHHKLNAILAVKGAAAASKKPVVQNKAEVEQVPSKTEHEALHNQIVDGTEAQEIDEIVIIKKKPELRPQVELVLVERREHEQQTEVEAEEVPVGIPRELKKEQNIESMQEVENAAVQNEQEQEATKKVKQAELPTALEEAVEKLTKDIKKLLTAKEPVEDQKEELLAVEAVEELTKDIKKLLTEEDPVEEQKEELLAVVEEAVEELTKDVEKMLVEEPVEEQKEELLTVVKEAVEELSKDVEKLLTEEEPVEEQKKELLAVVEEAVEELTKHIKKLLTEKEPVAEQKEEQPAAFQEKAQQLKEDIEELLDVKKQNIFKVTKEIKEVDLPTVIEEIGAEIEEIEKLIIEEKHIVKTTVVQEEAAEVETHGEETTKAEQEQLPEKTKDAKVKLQKQEIKYMFEAEPKPENAFPEILKQLYSSKDQFLFTNMKTKHEQSEKVQAEESDEYEIIIKRVLKVKDLKQQAINEEEQVAVEEPTVADVRESAPQNVEEPVFKKSLQQIKVTQTAELEHVEKPAVVEIVAVEPVPLEAAPEVPAELIEQPQAENIVDAAPEHTEERAACTSGADYEPHPTDCSRFVQCNHGFAVDLYCGDGLYWDALNSLCDWSNENCFKSKN